MVVAEDGGGRVAAGEILDDAASDAASAVLEAADLCVVDFVDRELAGVVRDCGGDSASARWTVLVWKLAVVGGDGGREEFSLECFGGCDVAGTSAKAGGVSLCDRFAGAAGGDVCAADDFSGDDAEGVGAAEACGEVHCL